MATQMASTASPVQGLRVPDERGTEIKLPPAPLGRNLKTSLEQAHLAASEQTPALVRNAGKASRQGQEFPFCSYRGPE
jgi:hypothetical protein